MREQNNFNQGLGLRRHGQGQGRGFGGQGHGCGPNFQNTPNENVQDTNFQSLNAQYIQTCHGPIDKQIFERLKKIKLVGFDVDGTLTEGGIYLDPEVGEYKKFYTKDGLGMSHAVKVGLKIAIVTARNSKLTQRRMDELGVTIVMQGQQDKRVSVETLMKEHNLQRDEIAVMGDDLNDVPLFEAAGFSACPKDAHPYMLQIADLVLHYDGGRGAARELLDLILMSQGKLPLCGGPF